MANIATNMGPPMELGCGPADPALSSSFSSYAGAGYNPVRGGTGTVGTINTAPLGSQQAPPGPRQGANPQGQLLVYRGADGNIYAVDPSTQIAYQI
jgi:hypothetical protein